MRAVVENPQVIKDYLEVERNRECYWAPLSGRSSHQSFRGHSQVEPARKMVADCRLVPSRGEECQQWDQ